MIENAVAITGVKKILSKLSTKEVIALCATVTQGLLKNKIQLREEAIDNIIKYSPDATSFLRRKIITRNHLFEYTHETGIEITLPSTKDDLIENIIQYWSTESSENIKIVDGNNTTLNDTNNTYNNDLNSTSNEESSSVCIQEENQVSTDIQSTISTSDLELLALQFSTWFYQLMNTNEVISKDHFYPDASIQIRLVNNELTMNEEVTHNSEEVVNLLFKIKQQHELYFNPNLNKQGTKAKMDPHGLVMIMSCGTLHINNIISGVFEQLFNLARDPFSENNWKIKSSVLILRSSNNVNQMPQLTDGELFQIENR